MTVIPFPRRVPSPKAVADFKRVCDAAGVELRENDEAMLDRIEREIEPNRPKPLGPPIEGL